ncbi:hydrolase 1, exosortase A system-associated [Thalassotalea euphylliae]|uniref:Hydrolase 1, exosortase A system-associated n=1 Tax=Thalassotalea euphylliae TaxID=1655234 RepID=A0A3E0TLS4_9GAMM|nr:hydrolase 1, exosortase A system-associated [Thalassotalea euphylliae]REL25220.1 hydrolase 1, exosortase A system-associated [Thalassotalea euphylliae]
MEYAFTFSSNNEQLLSIVHPSVKRNDTGVLIVVGGPQYRVGSHRQFVQLARCLADAGYTTMRFDYTGMGDSSGKKAEFDAIDDDIRAAIDAFMQQQPELKRVVIWGLCDAASAALIYGHQDTRVKGLVILNPWLRSEQAMGKTMLKFYYVQRLFSPDFWRKLIAGKVNVTASVKEVKNFAADSVGAGKTGSQTSYQERMKKGLQQFNGKLLLILSGNDLTAKEFEQQAFTDKAWQKIKSAQCFTERLSDSDHTFSTSAWKRQVEQHTVAFLQRLK